MFVSPQNSYVQDLTPNMMVLGGEAFRRWLGHKGRVLMNEIVSYRLTIELKRSQSAPSSLLPRENTRRRSPLLKQKVSPHETTNPLVPWSWTSRTVSNKFLLFINHLVYSILLLQPEQTKTPIFHQRSTYKIVSPTRISNTGEGFLFCSILCPQCIGHIVTPKI